MPPTQSREPSGVERFGAARSRSRRGARSEPGRGLVAESGSPFSVLLRAPIFSFAPRSDFFPGEQVFAKVTLSEHSSKSRY